MRKALLIPFLAIVSALGWAQGSYEAFPIQTATGVAIAGANIALCSGMPTQATPCGGSTLLQTYSDITLATACTLNPSLPGPTSGAGCTNPSQADGFGMARLYINSTSGSPAGFLYYQAYGQGILVPDIEPIMFPGTGGGGSITGATINGGLVETGSTLGLLTSCSSTQVLKWSGSAWACATASSEQANQSISFVNALTTTLLSSFNNTSLVYACWDNNSPANAIYPSNVAVNQTTFAITFTFAAVQSGFCVVNGSGTGSSSASASFGIVSAGSVNGALNPASCGSSTPALWCSGSEIGAWTMAAIGALPIAAGAAHCGEIYIPAGNYTQTTSISLPRCVKLHGASGQGTRITWGNSSGWQIIVADNNVPLDNNYNYEGAIEDLSLLGPGVSNTAGAIYLGGSDGGSNSPPLTGPGSDPASNFGDHFNINRVRIFQPGSVNGFNVGIQWGANAWSDTVFESVVSFCGTGMNLPSTIGSLNSGEDISILNSTIGNNTGIGIVVGTGSNVDLTIVNSSVDFNGPTASCPGGGTCTWQIQNGTTASQNIVRLSNSYIIAGDHWIQNFGVFNIFGINALPGNNSGVLGYLIDNENVNFSAYGGEFNNSGSGQLMNGSGAAGNFYGSKVSGSFSAGIATYADQFGNGTFNSSITTLGGANIGVVNTNAQFQQAANKMAGVSACSGSTKAITFGFTYTSQPSILLFDETTKGGINLTAKSTSGFTASCTGATDAFDWLVIGNPN
jgi:hypothetical protein